MARPPKPTSMHEATGAFDKNPSRREARKNEPVPPEGEVDRPAFVKGRAAKIWAEVAPMCVAMGTLKPCDARAFGKWCCLQAAFEEDLKNPVASLIAQARAYEEKFGIAGGGSRAKISVEGPQGAENKVSKYFAASYGPGSQLRQ